MGKYTRIYNKFQGYTLADCSCEYCLYYGGKRKGKVTCLADECVCKDEIEAAKRRERRKNDGEYKC